MEFLIVTCIFAAVLLLSGGILYAVLSRGTELRERLDKLAPAPASSVLIEEMTPFQRFLRRMGEKIPYSTSDRSKYTQLLLSAGFSRHSTPIFLGIKLVLLVALPLLYFFLFVAPRRVALDTQTLLILIAAAIVGFLLPSWWLTRKAEGRKQEIFYALPDVLDLLTVCVEGGLSVDAAIVRTVDNFTDPKNPLIQEFRQTAMEIRAGRPRREALLATADRCMVADLRSLIGMITQAERFGTSIGTALRVHADTLRVRRSQMAEEAAAKTAVKMLFPLVFFVFPALLVVMLGPAMFLLQKVFAK